MVTSTTRSRLLVAVSVAQLATGVAGLVAALRRRHPYDVFWMHGRTDTIARDTILRGHRALRAGVEPARPGRVDGGGPAARPGRWPCSVLGVTVVTGRSVRARSMAACRLSPYGRQVQRRLAELIRVGRPRRAYAALGPALAATAAGGRCFAALMRLFGGSQRPDGPPTCW